MTEWGGQHLCVSCIYVDLLRLEDGFHKGQREALGQVSESWDREVHPPAEGCEVATRTPCQRFGERRGAEARVVPVVGVVAVQHTRLQVGPGWVRPLLLLRDSVGEARWVVLCDCGQYVWRC